MKKDYYIFIMIIALIMLIIFGLTLINVKSVNLKEYKLLSGEKIVKEFKYKDNKYVLSTYHKDKFTYDFNNILLKDNNNYYLIDKIEQCDMSYYVKGNEIYVHCIGKKGNILKYTIDNNKVKKDIISLNYKDTPNISEIHINIDKVDNDYIYLKSTVKVNDKIKEGEHVKCLLSSRKCEYN